MFFSNLRVLFALAIFFLIAELCDARFVGTSPRESGWPDFGNVLKARQDKSSSCSPWCEPGASCSSNGCSISPKRHLNDMFPAIKRRSLERSLANRQVPNAQRMNHEELHEYLKYRKPLVHTDDGELAPVVDLGPVFGYEQPSYCVQKRFEDMEMGFFKSWIAGTGDKTELRGCTVLTIVSSQAVYMCHIWEDAHYLPRFQENYYGTRWSSGFNDFLNFLGGQYSERARGPAISPELFQGHDPAAFIMTPRLRLSSEASAFQEYPQQFGALAIKIGRIIPDLSETDDQGKRVRIRWYNYDTATDLTYEFVRQALFEYKKSMRDGRPGWQLFYEDYWMEKLL